MKFTACLFLCCSLVMARWASSQTMGKSDNCTTTNAHEGKMVSITDCPPLLKIATSPVISIHDKRYLEAHICGHQLVCCELSMIKATDVTVVPATTTNTISTAPISITSGRNSESNYAGLSKLPLPNDNVCGLDSASPRIIGGEKTDMIQFRWTVALDYNLPNKKGVRCGGSLINTRYVLTAAHCVYSTHEYELTLRLGDWDIELDPDCDKDGNCNDKAEFVNVSRIIIHPEYKRDHTGSKVNDIALLRMEKALPGNYTVYILPICMPMSITLMQDLFANRNVSIVGWGSDGNETRNRFKMYSVITTISNHKCEKELEKTISDSQMCAKSLTDNYSDACEGDSGGPLQIQINGTYYLIGIVSYGPRCGTTTLPAVYTRVTSYMAWILENIIT
nr:melanization protease 1-like isoform X1 [Aedes albopictus]